MSDWRSGEPSQKSKPPTPARDFPEVSSKPTGGWKGRPAKAATNTNSPTARTWTGDAAEGVPLTSSALRKWVAIFSLSISAVLLLFGFRYWLSGQPKLPLFVFGVSRYEASPELLENPFADSQRNNFIAANSKNIAKHKFLNSSGDDNALTTLTTDDWLDKFKLKEMSGKSIKSGGPDEKIVAFYINAYASFTPQNDLQIYSQHSNPFADDGEQGLRLEDLLKNIAVKIRAGSLAWVILDLQVPASISNLNDLDPKWQTAAEQALDKLDPSLQQRLLITLPGENGQQNWLAPELNGSFFGHYLLQLIEGRFSEASIFDESLTVAEFQKLLDEKVSNRVSNRRFALQHPVWIPEATVNKVAETKLFTFPKDQVVARQEWADAKMQFDDIDALWSKVSTEKYQAGYRWDPMGYAKVESQLLALEDIAITRRDSFGEASNFVKHAWGALKKPVDHFEVSLIEDEQRDLYFHRSLPNRSYEPIGQLAKKLVSNLKDSSEAVPSFWKTPPAPGSAETAPPPEAIRPPAERPFLLWKFYLEAANGEERTWRNVFSRDRLDAALAYVGSSGNTEWLEIYLLRRMAIDIDWKLPNMDRPKACAEALRVFHRLQSLATHPEPELSWWLKGDLDPVDKQFLRGFDLLLANEAGEAIQEFIQASAALGKLEPKARNLANIIAQTDEVLHAIPYMLAWLSREYQVVQNQEKSSIAKRLEDLGRLAGLASTVYQLLEESTPGNINDIDSRFFKAGNDLIEAFAKLNSEFETYVLKKTDRNENRAASNSPQTFRRERIVLCTPFLSLDDRKKLHSNTSAFLKSPVVENSEQGVEIVPPSRSGLAAVDIFLEAVTGDREKWRTIAKTDIRVKGLAPFADVAEPAFGDPLSVRLNLRSNEFWQRCYAPSYGAFPTLHTKLANANREIPWPWTCAWQRWSLADANYRLLQVSRLSEASWGRGTFSRTSSADSFYFYQLGEKYRVPGGRDESSSFGKLTGRFQTEIDSIRSEKIERLKSLSVSFGGNNQPLPSGGGTVPIKYSRGSDWDWDCVAQIFMGPIEKRIPWQPSKNDERTLVADFRSPETFNQQFDATPWQKSVPPNGTLALRCNLLTNPIRFLLEGSKLPDVELVMERIIPEKALVRILPPKEKPIITVLMLIDCSKSMKIQVTLPRERNQNPNNVQLFTLVKKNAKAILNRLADIHGRDANVKFGLIPFGLEEDERKNLGPLQSLLLMRPEDFCRTKEIKLLDLAWQQDIEAIIDKLAPSGDTPLYNAIDFAIDSARENADQSNEQTFIFVLSDGVNHIDPEPLDSKKVSKVSKSVDVIRDSMESNKRVRLSIFHYDFFETWLEKQELAVREDWRKEYKVGKSELDSLKSLGKDRYAYKSSAEAAKLVQESLDTIPRSQVTIRSIVGPTEKVFSPISGLLGELITIDRDYLPSDFKIELNGPLGNASGLIELLGGEHLELAFDVSEHRLAFDRFPASGWETLKGEPVGSNLSSIVYLKTLDNEVKTSHQLGFELNFCNKNLSEFTRRPRFVVAELSETEKPERSAFILADQHYMSQTHYPQMRLSNVPWPPDQPLATLRVWASDTLPNNLKIQSLEPSAPGTIKLGIANVNFSHTGSDLIAEVKYDDLPKAKDRVVVICPDFEKAHRTFSTQDAAEKHVFTLPERLKNKASRLQFTTISELENAAQMKQVTTFIFDSIQVVK